MVRVQLPAAGAVREQQVGRGAERLSGPGVAAARHRLHARRTRRPDRRQEPGVLLLQPRVPSAAGRTLRAGHAPADGARATGDFSRDARRQRRAVQPHLRSAVRAAEGGVLGHRDVGMLPRRRRPRPRPGESPVRSGHGPAEPVSAAERAGGLGAGLQLRGRHASADVAGPDPGDSPRLPGAVAAAADGEVGRADLARAAHLQHPARFRRHAAEVPAVVQHLLHRHTRPRPGHLPRGELRAQPEPPRLAAGVRVDGP